MHAVCEIHNCQLPSSLLQASVKKHLQPHSPFITLYLNYGITTQEHTLELSVQHSRASNNYISIGNKVEIQPFFWANESP